MEMTLKYYDDRRILVALYFSLEIIVQVFDAVTGDEGMRLDHIFIFLTAVLLVAYVLSYFVYIAWSFLEKPKNL